MKRRRNRLCEEHEFLYQLIFLPKRKFIQSVKKATTNQISAVAECIENSLLIIYPIPKTKFIQIKKLQNNFHKCSSTPQSFIIKNFVPIRFVMGNIFSHICLGEICKYF
jgi:hypothetical protein